MYGFTINSPLNLYDVLGGRPRGRGGILKRFGLKPNTPVNVPEGAALANDMADALTDPVNSAARALEYLLTKKAQLDKCKRQIKGKCAHKSCKYCCVYERVETQHSEGFVSNRYSGGRLQCVSCENMDTNIMGNNMLQENEKLFIEGEAMRP